MREFTLNDGFTLSAVIDKMGISADLNSLMDEAQKRGKEGAAYIGGQFIMLIVKKLHLAKDDVIKMLADLTGDPVDEVGKYSIAKTKEVLGDLFKQTGFTDFFKQAGV